MNLTEWGVFQKLKLVNSLDIVYQVEDFEQQFNLNKSNIL